MPTILATFEFDGREKNLFDRATLFDSPAVHDNHSIGQRDGLPAIMSDQHDRNPEAAKKPSQLGAELISQRRVEGGQRLVKK